MSAADITAIVLAGGGLLATLLTFISSARNTDLEAVKAIVRSQQEQIASLQRELKEEREHSASQDRAIRERDQTIAKLREDLNEAYAQIRKLRGHD